jgi:hypothetical protein
MENVVIQDNAFVFCRYTIAGLIWLALLLHSLWLLVLVFVVLAASALLKVNRAPMVVLWTSTLGRVVRSRETVLDVRAMRFAHSMGSALAAVSIVLVALGVPFAWWFVAAFAALKTLSALGFCPAYKIWGCAIQGGCCALTSRRPAAQKR